MTKFLLFCEKCNMAFNLVELLPQIKNAPDTETESRAISMADMLDIIDMHRTESHGMTRLEMSRD